ncbi:Ketoreductase azaE [Psilocybe cubensis]|uniref:Ketoreductase azaE n=2 Tax=Psilocybe cubensis TaxID=181762 RepID=A0ACB8HHW4_PSICU|nr:Ketoreductase azaE [Psilocybe cubensis]KAH9487453.1 Ketoreductase azaE [Psilocybe cubensis]
MPAVSTNSNSKVLVTGANGFLALWIVRVLLEHGFIVRGTVRTADKGNKLKQIFSTYGDKLEWVVVPDIIVEGAFDKALEDIDAVVHSASPVVVESEDPDAVIKPALGGTESIFNSILKYGTKVKRVVLTSSMGALIPIMTGPVVLNENSWGDDIVQLVKQLGKAAPQITKYWASKTLAERAAWDIYEKNKPEIGWELVVLNPSIRPVQDFSTPAEAPHSNQMWYNHIVDLVDEEGVNGTFVYVDVRDVAEAHMLSITKEAAGGERFVLSAGSSGYQKMRDTVFALKPEYYTSGLLPRGNPDVQGEPLITTNTTKAEDILGIKYKTLEETIENTLAGYEVNGLVGKK